jgi:uncharacterized protein with NRDE domain
MCLILFSHKIHPNYRLILAANRDEFYTRPTAPLDYWAEYPDVLAGQDLKGNGTWLGVTRTGRIAALTNFREGRAPIQKAPSRGVLIRNYLTADSAPSHYLNEVRHIGHTYNGFNLITGDADGLFYYSNRTTRIHKLKPGLYGISNHLLDTSWPKVKNGKARLQGQLNGNEKIDPDKIFEILCDGSMPGDDELPDTGVGLQWERILSPLFITSSDYGTRSSSIVLIATSGRVSIRERTFLKTGNKIKKGKTRKFSFMINS